MYNLILYCFCLLSVPKLSNAVQERWKLLTWSRAGGYAGPEGVEMAENPESKPPQSAVRAWVASGERPVRGKGGRGRIGEIGRFLRREAAEIVRGRDEDGLTWEDVALAAAKAGITKADGTPFPGASYSTIWGRLVRKGYIKSHPPQVSIPPNAPAPWGQSGGRGTGEFQPPVPPVTPPPNPVAMRPTNPSTPGPPTPTGPNAMPRVRRWGDER